MEWFEAVLLGLIQGLTEFLPVSSSGHLEIGKEILGIETTDDLLFTTMVHAATVLSTIIVFRKQIWDILKGFFCGLKGVKIARNENGSRVLVCNDQTDYLLKMVVSMIPVFVVGVFFKDQVEALFGSIHVVGFALIATALLLFFSDYASRPGRKSIFPANTYRNGISYWQAFAVGLGQSFAVVPGLSRSGTTISTGLTAQQNNLITGSRKIRAGMIFMNSTYNCTNLHTFCGVAIVIKLVYKTGCKTDLVTV